MIAMGQQRHHQRTRTLRSVRTSEQTPGDDLRLNLSGALEDRQDAGVAQHAADRELHRIAVAAVDLQRAVGVGERDSRGLQLRLARLDITTLSGVLPPRGVVG